MLEINFLLILTLCYSKYFAESLWFKLLDVAVTRLFLMSSDIGVDLAESLT